MSQTMLSNILRRVRMRNFEYRMSQANVECPVSNIEIEREKPNVVFQMPQASVV